MQVKLCFLPIRANHPAEHFMGGYSLKASGYEKVIAHDGAIKAEACGGPVFNAKGQFYGVNIARVSRTATLMLPFDVIRDFLDRSMSAL